MAIQYYYSPSTKGIYSAEVHGATIPTDRVTITPTQYAQVAAGTYSVTVSGGVATTVAITPQTAGADPKVIVDSIGIGNKFGSITIADQETPSAATARFLFGNTTSGYGALRLITNSTKNVQIDAVDWATSATQKHICLQPNGGNIGLGTATPSAKLYVVGESYVDYANEAGITGGALRLASSSNASSVSNNEYYDGVNRFTRTGGSGKIRIWQTNDAIGGAIDFLSGKTGPANTPITYTSTMMLTSDGRVGIGIQTPAALLHVSRQVSGTQDAGLYIGYVSGGVNYSQNYYDANEHYFRMGSGSPLHTSLDATGTRMSIPRLTIVAPANIADYHKTIGLCVIAAPYTNGGHQTVAGFYNNTAASAGTGGGIALGGLWDGTSVNNATTFAELVGAKENDTAGNYAGALLLKTRSMTTGGVEEAMRITSTGLVGIGTTTPTAKLQTIDTYNAARFGNNNVNALTIGGNGGSPYAGIGYNINFNSGSDNQYFAVGNDRTSLIRFHDGGFQFKGNATAGAVSGTPFALTDYMTILKSGVVNVPGTLSFNSGYGSAAVAYGCRAWVNFNGTGTIAINASGNVSSIGDNGAGDYTVNFTTSMSDANYCIATSGARTTGEIQVIGVEYQSPTKTTSAVRLGAKTYGVARSDSAECNVAIFR